MSEMLERCALAIALDDGYGADELIKMAGDDRVDPMPTYRQNARAALEAIKDCDDATGYAGSTHRDLTCGECQAIWADMIDSILSNPK